MTKRLTWTTLAVLLAFGITACGGSSGNNPTPVPTPTPPTQAAVTFNVDPEQVVANDAGNGWYRFKVNVAFSESAGIGYTVDTIRTQVSVTSSGQVWLNDLTALDMDVPANGREVRQFTTPLYQSSSGGRIALTVDFTARITDDRGNSLTATNQVTALHHGDPRFEIPQ